MYLDDVYMNDTPFMLKVVVGQHTIKLTKSGYDDEVRNVTVSVAETLILHVNMTGYGSLYICSDPNEAKVYLDGVFAGETALNLTKVVEGTHRIKLTKSSYRDVEKIKYVSAGELTEVDVTFSISPWLNLLIGGVMGAILAIVIPGISPKLKGIFMSEGDTVKRKKEISEQWNFLFSLDPSYRSHLKVGDVDEKLKKVFEENKQPLSTKAKLSNEKLWRIEDGEKQYSIKDKNKEKRLKVYKKE